MTRAIPGAHGKNPGSSRSKGQDTPDPCNRPARFIILRCGSVQSFFLVSSRMFAHSRADGSGGFRAWRSRARSVPPAEVPPFPAASLAACGSANLAGSEPSNRGLSW